jgi:hypothetical protein
MLKFIKMKLREVLKEGQNKQQTPIKEEWWNLVFQVDKALKVWLWSKKIIDQINDWDLIDQAVYVQAAAERRYMHLIKEARVKGIRADGNLLTYIVLSARNQL